MNSLNAARRPTAHRRQLRGWRRSPRIAVPGFRRLVGYVVVAQVSALQRPLIAPRSWTIWTKSLKCPAWRLASRRLSTNVSSFPRFLAEFLGGILSSDRTIEVLSTVTAELRPSASGVASG